MGSDLEFGGTLGAPFMILGLPFAVYAINSACSPVSYLEFFFDVTPPIENVYCTVVVVDQFTPGYLFTPTHKFIQNNHS